MTVLFLAWVSYNALITSQKLMQVSPGTLVSIKICSLNMKIPVFMRKLLEIHCQYRSTMSLTKMDLVHKI
jgi:hypothetical protein